MPNAEELSTMFTNLERRVVELEQVQGVHRALISQHQSALKTVAQIMEVDRNVDATL